MGQTDYEQAEIEIINGNLSSFAAGWLTCVVTSDRIQFQAQNSGDFEAVRDIAVGVLKALPHTPVAALGINRDVHFEIADALTWHAIGDALVPKDFWGDFLHLPGMRSIAVEGVRRDLWEGREVIIVEPSNRVQLNGVYVAHNDHFDLRRLKKPPADRETGLRLAEPLITDASSEKMRMALDILNDEWKSSMERADVIIFKFRMLAANIKKETRR